MKIIYKKNIAFVLLVCFCLVIFYFSNQDGARSGELSNNLFIRKLAHISEYFILACLSFNFFVNYFTLKTNKNYTKVLVISFFFCLLYAISDEVHQTFIPYRSGTYKDVLIDSVGIFLGIFFAKHFHKFLFKTT